MFFNGFNSRLNAAEEEINCLKTGQYKLPKLKYKEKKKKWKVWNRMSKNWDNIKHSNICVIRIPERENQQ